MNSVLFKGERQRTGICGSGRHTILKFSRNNGGRPQNITVLCDDIGLKYHILYMYVCRFQNVVLRCPTPRLHCFLYSHRPSCRFLSFMAFLISSIQFFFGLPRALLCFGIHFNAILGNLPSAILWTWPSHVSWFCSISFIIRSSNPICCLVVTFLILSFLDILEDLLRAGPPSWGLGRWASTPSTPPPKKHTC